MAESTVDASGIATSLPMTPEHPGVGAGLTAHEYKARPVLVGDELSVTVTVTL
jgi:hypothetical protein